MASSLSDPVVAHATPGLGSTHDTRRGNTTPNVNTTGLADQHARGSSPHKGPEHSGLARQTSVRAGAAVANPMLFDDLLDGSAAAALRPPPTELRSNL